MLHLRMCTNNYHTFQVHGPQLAKIAFALVSCSAARCTRMTARRALQFAGKQNLSFWKQRLAICSPLLFACLSLPVARTARATLAQLLARPKRQAKSRLLRRPGVTAVCSCANTGSCRRCCSSAMFCCINNSSSSKTGKLALASLRSLVCVHDLTDSSTALPFLLLTYFCLPLQC